MHILNEHVGLEGQMHILNASSVVESKMSALLGEASSVRRHWALIGVRHWAWKALVPLIFLYFRVRSWVLSFILWAQT